MAMETRDTIEIFELSNLMLPQFSPDDPTGSDLDWIAQKRILLLDLISDTNLCVE